MLAKVDKVKLSLTAVSLFAVAIALRVYALSRTSFSVDESVLLFFSTHPSLQALTWDNNPPLFHVIAKIWFALFPMTEFNARLLPALISACGPIFLLGAGVVTKHHRAGIAAGVLLAFSSLSIRTGQDCRMYALFEMVMAAQIFCYWLVVRRPSRGATIAFWFSILAALATHVFGLFASAMTLAISSSKRSRTWIATAALVIVVAACFSAFRLDSRFIAWQRLYYSLNSTALNNAWQFLKAFGQWDPVFLLIILGAAIAALFHRDAEQKRFARLSMGSLLLFFLGGFVSSIFFERVVLLPRYFVFLNPVLLWCAGLGCEVLWAKERKERALVLVGVLSFAIFSYRAYDYDKPHWRTLANIAVAQKASLVMTTRPQGLAVPYYTSAHIPLVQFFYGEDFPQVLEKQLKTHRVIWIVDDQWAWLRYERALVSSLNADHIPHRIFYETSELGETVFGLAVYSRDQ